MDHKDWLAVIISGVTSVFVTVVGMFTWFNKELNSYDDRITELEASHRVQMEQHSSNKQNMERMTEELINLDDKQDRQTETILKALGKA